MTETYEGFHDMDFDEEYGPAAFIMRARKEGLRDFGACMSPTTAFYILQGSGNAPLRMERHIANTRSIVSFLSEHGAVAAVELPGVAVTSGPRAGQAVAAKGVRRRVQLRAQGWSRCRPALYRALRVFSHLANVGDAKSLVIHPASTTHHRMDADALRAAGISEGTIRLSVGIEDPQDLIDDLARALHVSQKAKRQGRRIG